MLRSVDSKGADSISRRRKDSLLVIGDVNELDVVSTHMTECALIDKACL